MAGTMAKMLGIIVLFAISAGLVWTGWTQYQNYGGMTSYLTMGLGGLMFLVMIYGFAKLSK